MILLKQIMGTYSSLLQFLLFNINVILGTHQSIEAVIHIRLKRTSTSRIPVYVYTDKYTLFQEALLAQDTYSVTLRYYRSSVSHISKIQEAISSTYCFSCRNFPTFNAIQCERNFSYSVHCPNGFAICWLYAREYLDSIHLENSTISYQNRSICYSVLNTGQYAATDTSTTALSVIASTDRMMFTTPIDTKYVQTSTQTYCPKQTTVNSTLLSVDQKQNSSASVSTSVIAGVTVSIVIVTFIVILIVVMYIKRQRQKESANNSETPNVSLEPYPITFSGNPYSNQQDTSSDKHIDSKSTVCALSMTTSSTKNPNVNSYVPDALERANSVYAIAQSVAYSDLTCIAEGQGSTSPNESLSSNKQSCFCITVNNADSAVMRPVTGDIKTDNNTSEANKSVLNKVHPVSPCAEHATVNKNSGYKNFREIEQNKNSEAEHEYNNTQQDNTKLGRNEPFTNVYSKLRENIRHFEHPYGDVGVSKEEKDVSSTSTN